MSRPACLVPLALFAALPAAAHAQKVIPANATVTEGNASTYFPFIYDKTRVQHLVDGAAIARTTGVLLDFAYRRDGGGTTSYASRKVANLKVSLWYSAKTPATMSTTFASNVVAGTETVVFSGTYVLPANPPPAAPPAAFNVVFKPAKPFVYQRSKGSLVVEFVVPGAATSKSMYNLDAHSGPPAGAGFVFGKGGAFASGKAYSVGVDATKLTPSGRVSVSASGLTAAWPTLVAAGLSKTADGGVSLPVDLTAIGAPGNFINVSLDFLIPATLSAQGTTYGGSLGFPVPNQMGLVYQTFYAQWFFFDKASNKLGLVTSKGLAGSVGGGKTAPSRILYPSDSSRPTGWFDLSGSGGPVIRFGGTFN